MKCILLGCGSVIVGYPLDTIKVHLQTQDSKHPQYKGNIDCLKQIVAKESTRGLFRGMTSPLLSVAFVNGIVFGVYGYVDRSTSNPDSLSAHILAGSLAGFVQAGVSSPMELLKTRIQLQAQHNPKVKHLGPIQCYLHIKETEGFKTLFKNFSAIVTRDIPGFAAYFVSFEYFIRKMKEPNIFNTLMAGGLAGTVSWIITFPIDVIKSAIEADGMHGTRKYNGMIDCGKKGYQSEGYKFFCRGLSSILLRAFPMNAVCFLIVHYVVQLHEIHFKDLVVEYEQLTDHILRFSC